MRTPKGRKSEVYLSVVPCYKRQGDKSWRTSFDKENVLVEKRKFSTVKEAKRIAHHWIGKGRCVLVQPAYNEKDKKGRFFREWRSFDRGALKECRWDCP